MTKPKIFKQLNFIEQYMLKQYNAPLNIDGISGFIFNQLSIKENIGTLLFIFSRSFIVLMHINGKILKPAFGFSKEELRSKYSQFPFNWI